MHSQRAAYFPAQHSEEKVSKELLEQTEYIQNTQEILKKLMDTRIIDGNYVMLVNWEGWSDLEDKTS